MERHVCERPLMKVTPTVKFPSNWLRFHEEFLPAWVKSSFSPRETWKNKPFTREDSIFFGKGIVELSELFTESRPARLPAYFRHERFRSAYLLYFLPLQASKFVALFQEKGFILSHALKAARERPEGTLRVLDLGAGPGTASIALFLSLLDRPTELPKNLRFEWWDTQEPILKNGKQLLEDWLDRDPRWKGRVEIVIRTGSWQEGARRTDQHDLILMGNVMNETPVRTDTRKTRDRPFSMIEAEESLPTREEKPSHPEQAEIELLRSKAGAGGLLIVEPALHRTAQGLSQLRDVIAGQSSDEKVLPWFGPCLHAGRCPMARGRDWCHFSIPVEIPGRWFLSFSIRLGSQRQWLKYSYLWLRGTDQRKAIPAEPPIAKDARLVITDSLRRKDSDLAMVLLCEPDRTRRLTLSARDRIGRGDVIHLKEFERQEELTRAARPPAAGRDFHEPIRRGPASRKKKH